MNARILFAPAMALAIALPTATTAAPSSNVADMPGGHYVMDKHHSSLVASVVHMGVSTYRLRFDSIDGSFDYDPAHPEAARVQASVDAGSLDVGADYSSKFAEEFLTASKFPKISFVSTAVVRGDGNQGTMTGDLSFMGVTKPVTFNVTFIGTGRGLLPPFKPTAGLSATTTIKRSDFGSTYLSNLVGDDVTISIDGEFDKQ
jgi:polyisoprenoid-binding protein YceI